METTQTTETGHWTDAEFVAAQQEFALTVFRVTFAMAMTRSEAVAYVTKTTGASAAMVKEMGFA